MNWLTEWRALSAQIEGVLDASRFYMESLGTAQMDLHGIGGRQLLPHVKQIYAALEDFHASHQASIPEEARNAFADVFEILQKFPNLSRTDTFAQIHIWVTLLTSFRAQVEYHLTDTEFVAMRTSERAFNHLQRSIVADREVRNKWIRAFATNEPACERLGAVHLLLHGIWAFKLNTEGERTDLVFPERPFPEYQSIARSADALVLTEWKRVVKPSKLEQTANAARKQTARYTGGTLGGLELARYRFIVLVTQDVVAAPPDYSENGVTYRHINIAVDPKVPSKQ
jgi:hypothetical protein